MALTDFLTSIADAIRYAESSVGTINAQQFATRIRALSGGGTTEKVTVTYDFSNNVAGNACGNIYLYTEDESAEGNYSLFWGNDMGVMTNYTAINPTPISLVAETSVGYTKLTNPFNAIPKYATKVFAVKNGIIEGTYNIPSSKLWDSGNYGEHLYSVGLISDMHVQYDTGLRDLPRALAYFDERESVVATVGCGDLTSGGSASQLNEWKTTRDNCSPNTPVFTCNGNHESKSTGLMCTNPTQMRQYLDSEWTTETLNYFVKEIGTEENKDVFVFVPCFEGVTSVLGNTMFTNDCLNWLETTLETYRNQRVFLFQHIPPRHNHCPSGFGTGNGVYGSDIWGNTQASDRERFLELMAHYKNVIWFSGHSHIKYQYQENWINLNACQYEGASRFIHISSLTVPRDIIDGSITEYIYAESEASVMDIYENCIILRSRDLSAEQFIGIAQYLLDTTPQIVPPKPIPTEKVLTSISATKTKTSYNVGDTLSTSDIVVTAHYNDDTTAIVTTSATIDASGVVMSTAGTYNISVSYTEDDVTETTSISITVSQSGGEIGTITLAWVEGIKGDTETGVEAPDANYAMSDRHEVPSGQTVTYNISASFTTTTALPKVKFFWYDADGDFLSASSGNDIAGSNKTSSSIQAVANAKYFKLRLNNTASLTDSCNGISLECVVG